MKIAWPGSRCLLCLWPVKQIDIYNEPRLRRHIPCKNLAISSLLINSNPLFGQLHLMCCLSLPKRRGSITGIFLPFFLLFSTYNRPSIPSRFNFLSLLGWGVRTLISIELLQFKCMLTLNKIPDRYLEKLCSFS